MVRNITLFLISLLLSTLAFSYTHNQSIEVDMYDKYFQPAQVTIHPGETVVWVNKGKLNHDVTSAKGLFASGTVPPGGKMSYTFTKPGVYGYACARHSFWLFGMTGKVIVRQ